jgi:DNA excision repair protein ERCC-4
MSSDHGQSTGLDVENPTPPEAEYASASTPNDPRKKWKILFYATFLVAVIAISVSLGIILPENTSDAALTSTSASSAGETNSNDVVTLNSPTEAETTTSSSTASPATGATDQDIVVVPETITASTSSVAAAATESSASPTQSSLTTQFIQSNGPLEAKVRMIDPTAVQSYDSCDALEEDIINALKHFANSIITNEISNDWWAKCDPDDPNWNPWGGGHFGPPISIAYGAAEADDAAMMPEMARPAKVEEDSFETNNQVQGVDEADIVKSDGTHVFAAYGDILYAWNASDGTKGTSVTQMPYNETNCTDAFGPMPIPEPFLYYDYEDELNEGTTDTDSSASTSTRSSLGQRTRRHHPSRRDTSMPWYPPCYNPKPNIISLLLHGSRLTAIVSENNYMIEPYSADAASLISDHSALTIRVYDITTVPTDGSPLKLLGERRLKGNYNAARSIDSTGVVVTTSYVDTHVMANSLYRSQPLYCGLDNTEYEEKASIIALNRSEVFAEQLIKELDLNYGCNQIFQISAMQSGSTKDATSGDLLSQFVSVASFDMASNY